MKKQTVAEESRYKFNEIKHQVKQGNEKILLYLSGSKNKRTAMYKEVARYEKDANIDFELGIIEKDEYEIEIKSVKIFEQSLANYTTY